MNALIVGLGAIGSRHLNNLKRIDPSCTVTVWRQHANATAVTSGADNIVYTLEDALAAQPEIALLANPSSRHIETGLLLAAEGIHLFIEKPLSNSLASVDELITLCHRQNLILMVGYNLRFSPSLRAIRESVSKGDIGRPLSLRAEVGQHLPDWRPNKDYRQSVSANASRGGGAILELSHELDYARWIMGEIAVVSATTDRVSDLEIDVEDIAEITLKFKSRAIGNIHLDMIQRTPSRSCRVIGAEGTLVWDGISQRSLLYRAEQQEWIDLTPSTSSDLNETYIAEMRHFVDAVQHGCQPMITGEDGRRVIEIALAAKRSSRQKRAIVL